LTCAGTVIRITPPALITVAVAVTTLLSTIRFSSVPFCRLRNVCPCNVTPGGKASLITTLRAGLPPPFVTVIV